MDRVNFQCPQCGAELPGGVLQGLCPRCVGRQAEALLARASELAAPDPAGRAAGAFQPEEPGHRLGRYKLLQRLGEGGMGAVWMAEQEEPVRRRVALKILKLGMDSREILARFEAERQALAMMDHPNIARFFDAGVVGSSESQISDLRSQISDFRSEIHQGRPYFVMELVPGIRLTDYCDQNNLSTRERLDLFIKVCQAVQHAHQKGIIHRDLKPSNILVTLHDGVPVPKVIDFGIAKATAQPLTDKTLFTQLGAVLGTPAYMSPEQTELSGLDIDTRSDIYSLGVLLYQLLTGHPPFDPKELMAAGLERMCRTIREQEPPRPSTRLTTLGREDLATLAKRHGTQAPRLVHLVRGDLDWIVMRCLEKDRRRRYETANGLAADIQRHLANEPITACPPSASYRFHKFVRRNKVAVVTVASVALALLAGVVATGWMAVRAIRQRDRAIAAETKAEQRRQQAIEQTQVKESVLDFLMYDLLRQADSREQANAKQNPEPNLTVKDAVRRAAERIGARFSGRPAEEAAVRRAIGIAFQGIGEPQLALPHLERSLALFREQVGVAADETLAVMAQLADANNESGRFKEAVAIGEEALKLVAAKEGPESDLGLSLRTVLAQAHGNGGNPRMAISLAEEIVQARVSRKGSNDSKTVSSQLHLAAAYVLNSQYPSALALYESGLTWQRRHLPTNDLSLAFTLGSLGTLHGHLNQPDKALPFQQEALAIFRDVQGPDHPHTLRVMEGLARTYEQLGRRDENLALVEQVVRGREAKLGAAHPETLRSQARLAAAEFDAGQQGQGIERLERTLEKQQSAPSLGLNHRDTLSSMSLLARLYANLGRFSNSIPLLEDGLARSKQTLGPAHQLTRRLQLNLGANYVDANRLEEGIALLADQLRVQGEPGGSDLTSSIDFIRSILAAYERSRRYAAAEALQRLLLQTLQQNPNTNPLELATEATRLGRHLVEQGKFAEAETELQRALAVFQEKAPDHWMGFVTQAVLGSALAGRMRFAEAEPLLLAASERLQASRSAPVKYRRDVVVRLGRLYSAWDQHEPNTGLADKAAEWKRKLADFDQAAANNKPAGVEP